MISEMMEIIVRVLTKERERTREVVEAILDSEQEYLFTNDRDYKDNRSEIVANNGNQPIDPNNPNPQPQQQMQQRQQVQGGNVFVQELRQRIDQYFAIVLRNVRDSIPKAIGFFLVRKSQDSLQFELYN